MLKLLDTNEYELKTPGSNGRFFHLGTCTNTSTLKEYICYWDLVGQRHYVEDITGGHIKQIESDEEWREITEFFGSHQCLKIILPKSI